MTDPKTTNSLNMIASKSIPNGTKFVAIYGDGLGSNLFTVNKEGHLFGADGTDFGSAPDTALMDRNYAYWIGLPSSFVLWSERKIL